MTKTPPISLLISLLPFLLSLFIALFSSFLKFNSFVGKIYDVISKVVSHASNVTKTPYRQQNAFYAVLFECVQLILVYQDKELMKTCSEILSVFLSDKRAYANHVAYALKILSQLTRVSPEATKVLLNHQDLVLGTKRIYKNKKRKNI